MIQLKIIINVKIDPEEYPMPADGKVEFEVEDHVKEVFHEIEGISINKIKIIRS